jgi:hypothetical protein
MKTQPHIKGITAPSRYGEADDCSVRAVANASGKSYEEVHTVMKSLGRKDRQQMDMKMCAAGCMRLGGTIKIVNIELSQLNNGKYVIFQMGHCFCLIDGKIIDTIPTDLEEKIIGVFGFK